MHDLITYWSTVETVLSILNNAHHFLNLSLYSISGTDLISVLKKRPCNSLTSLILPSPNATSYDWDINCMLFAEQSPILLLAEQEDKKSGCLEIGGHETNLSDSPTECRAQLHNLWGQKFCSGPRLEAVAEVFVQIQALHSGESANCLIFLTVDLDQSYILLVSGAPPEDTFPASLADNVALTVKVFVRIFWRDQWHS